MRVFRILKNGLTSGEHFLNVFAAELKAATDDLDALELKILHENVKHAQHKETVAMIAEDFSSRYIALMCVRENLETITKILKKVALLLPLYSMLITHFHISI